MKEDTRSVAGQVLREMKADLHHLHGFKLCFVSRIANFVAHTCAREALTLEALSPQSDVTPMFLIDAVQSDSIPPSNE